MPRFYTLPNFDPESGRSRPTQGVLEVAYNDSIQTIDIMIEPRIFLKLARMNGASGQGWSILTNITDVMQKVLDIREPKPKPLTGKLPLPEGIVAKGK
jgi:hypothetical protein